MGALMPKNFGKGSAKSGILLPSPAPGRRVAVTTLTRPIPKYGEPSLRLCDGNSSRSCMDMHSDAV